MKYAKNQLQPKSFKKRNFNNYVFKRLKFGDCGVIFSKNYRIENIYLFDLKKKFKFFLVQQKKGLNKKLWIFIKKNYPISKKSKNSRMGKGKGKYIRLCTQVFKNSTFLEFLNINPILLKKILSFFSKKNFFIFNYIFKYNTDIFWKKNKINYYKEYKRF